MDRMLPEMLITPVETSETRIEAEISSRLASAPVSSLRSVACTYSAGVVTLTGVVGSYYHKQIAQVLLRGIDGVCRLENHLEVRPG